MRRVVAEIKYEKAEASRKAIAEVESKRLDRQMANRGHDINPMNRRCLMCGKSECDVKFGKTFCENGIDNLRLRGILQ